MLQTAHSKSATKKTKKWKPVKKELICPKRVQITFIQDFVQWNYYLALKTAHSKSATTVKINFSKFLRKLLFETYQWTWLSFCQGCS